jgi:hypothetical protein
VAQIEGVTVTIEEVVLEIDTRVDTITCIKTLELRSNMQKPTINMLLDKAETEDTIQEEVTTTLPYKQATEKEEAMVEHSTIIKQIQDTTTITTMNKIMIIMIDNIDTQELNNIVTMMEAKLK